MKMITHDKSRHDNCKKKNSTNILHNLQNVQIAQLVTVADLMISSM